MQTRQIEREYRLSVVDLEVSSFSGQTVINILIIFKLYLIFCFRSAEWYKTEVFIVIFRVYVYVISLFIVQFLKPNKVCFLFTIFTSNLFEVRMLKIIIN